MSKLDRYDLAEALGNLGFKKHSTASMKWRFAMWNSTNQGTLLVLFRARGVDLLLTPLEFQQLLNDKAYISVTRERPGDHYAEYNYAESHEDIHAKVHSVAKMFSDGTPIETRYTFKKVGVGRSEWVRNFAPKTLAQQARAEMQELYEACSTGDGEGAYLGDGLWISPDGDIYEN